MKKTCMISQPRYLPAITYLQRIYYAAHFIILDTVQHNKQDFEHRNRIASSDSVRWLSLSIDRANGSRPPISQLHIGSSECLLKHKRLLQDTYAGYPYYDPTVINTLYKNPLELSLTGSFMTMLDRTFHILGLPYDLASRACLASSLPIPYSTGPSYLARLCAHVGCSQYISGPNGRNYIGDEFSSYSVDVLYHLNDPPYYDRVGHPYHPWLSWLDLLFCCGVDRVAAAISQPPLLADS